MYRLVHSATFLPDGLNICIKENGIHKVPGAIQIIGFERGTYRLIFLEKERGSISDGRYHPDPAFMRKC